MRYLFINIRLFKALLAVTWISTFSATTLLGYSANKVWMEFRDNGRYRVYVNYTVPELREFREVWVEFAKKKEAERYYFDLVRGADFFMPEAKLRSFQEKPAQPTPW